MAKSRTIFGLVVRRCYSPEFFRKRKVSSLDDRLVKSMWAVFQLISYCNSTSVSISLFPGFWIPDILARFVFAIDSSILGIAPLTRLSRFEKLDRPERFVLN